MPQIATRPVAKSWEVASSYIVDASHIRNSHGADRPRALHNEGLIVFCCVQISKTMFRKLVTRPRTEGASIEKSSVIGCSVIRFVSDPLETDLLL